MIVSLLIATVVLQGKGAKKPVQPPTIQPLPNWAYSFDLSFRGEHRTTYGYDQAKQDGDASYPRIRVGDFASQLPEDADLLINERLPKEPDGKKIASENGFTVFFKERNGARRYLVIDPLNRLAGYRIVMVGNTPTFFKWAEQARAKLGLATIGMKNERDSKHPLETSLVTVAWIWDASGEGGLPFRGPMLFLQWAGAGSFTGLRGYVRDPQVVHLDLMSETLEAIGGTNKLIDHMHGLRRTNMVLP